MAGHSKWANIKHRKGAQDVKRGKIFGRCIREITVATKQGGPVAENNPRLRAAVQTALNSNMTKDTIKKAIERASSTDNTNDLEELVYEGYAGDGVAVLVECMTDSRNRTISEVRHAFSKHGASLGASGSVAYLFKRQGVFGFDNVKDADALMELAMDVGVDDIVENADVTELITSVADFSEIQEKLEKAGFTPDNAEITMLADTYKTVDFNGANKVTKFIEVLEDLEDVQNVYTNMDIPQDVLDKLENS